MDTSYLVAYLDQIVPKPVVADPEVPALLQPKKAVAGVNNDKVGVCPFCSKEMQLSSISINNQRTTLPVYVCPSDQYVAPLPNDTQPT